MTFELGYSYVNLGDGMTGELVTKDGFGAGQNHVMTFKNITSHDLKFGVRWDLSYAPPPLVRKG